MHPLKSLSSRKGLTRGDYFGTKTKAILAKNINKNC